MNVVCSIIIRQILGLLEDYAEFGNNNNKEIAKSPQGITIEILVNYLPGYATEVAYIFSRESQDGIKD